MLRHAIAAKAGREESGGGGGVDHIALILLQQQRDKGLEDLLDTSGRLIAGLIGAEAAYVTPGAAAALALGAAACMTGGDLTKMAQLPDTAGIKREILIQKRQRYKYDRALTVFGARLVEVGDDAGTTPRQLEAAIGPSTPATFWWPAAREGVVSLEDCVRIGRASGVPILVDAAGQVYPVERMRSFPAAGADLIAYAAKYFGAPNASGFLAGKRELVGAAAAQGFSAFEHGFHAAIGRPLKLDRQVIIAVVVALQEWLATDHEVRLRNNDRKAQTIARAIRGLAGVTVTPRPDPPAPATSLLVCIDPKKVGRTVVELGRTLELGYPAVWVGTPERFGPYMGVSDPTNYASIFVGTLADGDEDIVAERLRAALTGEP